MRLLVRLLISHTAPVLVISAALAVTLMALVRMTLLLAEVRERELGALQLGERVHRAGWAAELAMRRALKGCEAGAAAAARPTLEAGAEELRALLADTAAATSPMAPLARGYLELVEALLRSDQTCAALLSAENQRRRWALDEQLTDLWASQMAQLHDGVARKDEEARRVGAVALAVGMATAVAALLLGLFVAQRLARLMTGPLHTLAQLAHRVGEGDFTSPARVKGPMELEALGDELDRMRLRLAELDGLKQSFLASVSHELRTPLSQIREALALLDDGAAGALSDRQRRLVGLAKSACEREIRTVSTLLDLTRLQSGVPIVPQSGTSLDEALRTAVADLDEARARQVEVRLDLRRRGALSRMDVAMVERAVLNLLRNAIAVSKPGQRVHVERRLTDGYGGRAGPTAVVTVRDEGPGVPAEVRPTLFKAFVTHPVAKTGKGQGVGLGLALSREVARAHGGDVELVDAPEPGATFRLWLPLGSQTAALAAGGTT